MQNINALDYIYEEMRKQNKLLEIQNAIELFKVTQDPKYLEEAMFLRGEHGKFNDASLNDNEISRRFR